MKIAITIIPLSGCFIFSRFSTGSAFMGQRMSSSSTNAASTIHSMPEESKSHLDSSSTRLWSAPEPLAEEGSWQAFLDEESTGLIYYFDTKTGESLWEPPTATFPEVRLPRRKQRLADNLRKDYRKSRQQEMMNDEEDEDSDIRGQSNQMTTSTAVAEVDTEVIEEPESPKWIEGIFDDETKEPAQQTESVAKEQEQQNEPKQPWFGFFDDGAKKDDGTASDASKKAIGEPEPQNWLKDIFGVGKEATPASEMAENRREGAGDSREGKKLGILESFSSFSTSAVATREEKASVQVEKPKPKEKKEKPVEKKREEKIVDDSPQPIKIEMGSHILPHPAKVRWGGEDAVFVKGRTFGVFDGVSGADKLDGVPLYSRTLANEMKKMVGAAGVTVQDMTSYLTDAAAYADGAATGASTAVVASIGENGFLQALNVGDSYCIVIRDGKITAKTREISHYWECPYQLSEDSPDRPRDGTKLNVELVPGDVIIMGSDGVFDNVNDDLLLNLVGKVPPKPTPLARKICDLSRKQSLDKNSETPYAKQAQRRGDPDYRDGLGGKVDDVSCVVVVCK